VSTACVYRVLLETEWQEMLAAGQFTGSAVDVRDGFIHMSAREQVAGTIATHFASVASDLIVLEIDASALEGKLRWETSRGGALFPHLYGVLPLTAITRTLHSDEFGE
jgi:uncharacterized protein (DUF952 family)